MNLLYPRIGLDRWWPILLASLLGALVAGLYGVVHDEITYTISREYFTELKFRQFQWANTGLPERLFVAEIGFLATWWVGFFAAWIICRMTSPLSSPREMFWFALRGFPKIIGSAFASGVIGYVFGIVGEITPETSSLADFAGSIGVYDIPAFVRVGYIHNAGYLGALLGIAWSAIAQRRCAGRRLNRTPDSPTL